MLMVSTPSLESFSFYFRTASRHGEISNHPFHLVDPFLSSCRELQSSPDEGAFELEPAAITSSILAASVFMAKGFWTKASAPASMRLWVGPLTAYPLQTITLHFGQRALSRGKRAEPSMSGNLISSRIRSTGRAARISRACRPFEAPITVWPSFSNMAMLMSRTSCSSSISSIVSPLFCEIAAGGGLHDQRVASR
jgi:hypothetical protein